MKKMMAVLLLATACATTGTAADERSPREQAMEQLIAEQQAELEQYRKDKVGNAPAHASSNAAIAAVESQRNPRSAPGPAAGLQCAPSNRPVEYAWLYRDPPGCPRSSPFSLEIYNAHDNLDVRFMIDGKDLVVLGATGPLCVQAADGSVFTPIPSQKKLWTCLDRKGMHSVAMAFYAKKRHGAIDVPTELKKYAEQVDFNRSNGPERYEINGYQSR